MWRRSKRESELAGAWNEHKGQNCLASGFNESTDERYGAMKVNKEGPKAWKCSGGVTVN